jgi:hypothetical protein
MGTSTTTGPGGTTDPPPKKTFLVALGLAFLLLVLLAWIFRNSLLGFLTALRRAMGL